MMIRDARRYVFAIVYCTMVWYGIVWHGMVSGAVLVLYSLVYGMV